MHALLLSALASAMTTEAISRHLDRALERMPITRSKLQLVGVTCLFLAAEFLEGTCHRRPFSSLPEYMDDFVYMCDGAYTRDEMLDMRERLFRCFDGELCVATARESSVLDSE